MNSEPTSRIQTHLAVTHSLEKEEEHANWFRAAEDEIRSAHLKYEHGLDFIDPAPGRFQWQNVIDHERAHKNYRLEIERRGASNRSLMTRDEKAVRSHLHDHFDEAALEEHLNWWFQVGEILQIAHLKNWHGFDDYDPTTAAEEHRAHHEQSREQHASNRLRSERVRRHMDYFVNRPTAIGHLDETGRRPSRDKRQHLMDWHGVTEDEIDRIGPHDVDVLHITDHLAHVNRAKQEKREREKEREHQHIWGAWVTVARGYPRVRQCLVSSCDQMDEEQEQEQDFLVVLRVRCTESPAEWILDALAKVDVEATLIDYARTEYDSPIPHDRRTR